MQITWLGQEQLAFQPARTTRMAAACTSAVNAAHASMHLAEVPSLTVQNNQSHIHHTRGIVSRRCQSTLIIFMSSCSNQTLLDTLISVNQEISEQGSHRWIRKKKTAKSQRVTSRTRKYCCSQSEIIIKVEHDERAQSIPNEFFEKTLGESIIRGSDLK